jgi:hypothetical protein
MFFRVQAAAFGMSMSVQLRQRGLFTSRKLEETYVYPGDYDTAAEAIEHGMRRVLARHDVTVEARAKYRAALKLAGDSE